MQRTLILALLASSCAFAQPETNHVFVSAGAVGGGFSRVSASPVQGAPYSATITNESVQTLADGNRIVQTSTGNTARDSMGRTRQDAPLPPIGNMSPADAPHLVFLQDPVAQASYTLNLTDKTAAKGPSVSGMAFAGPTTSVSNGAMISLKGVARAIAPPPVPMQQTLAIQIADEGQVQAEDLGSKTMESVNVTGTRTTRMIPAGQIGNDKPISIVTEVWTSPELKTVVYSKRSDPRMGDQTFQLTNIVLAEPDPSLFTVPSDFKVLDASGPIMYKTSGIPAQ
ncbi:MAG: hypothetical protein ABSG13_03800 [Bryobacteraceae bacterium]|jgi:hypothetical protein